MILQFFPKLIEIPLDCLKIEWVCRLIGTHGKTEQRETEAREMRTEQNIRVLESEARRGREEGKRNSWNAMRG